MEAVSSAGGCLFNIKSEERGKKVREKRETKAAFEGERMYHGLDQYSSHLLLYLLFRFVLTWGGSIPLPPLLMPYLFKNQ
jgi:hypothetical protein